MKKAQRKSQPESTIIERLRNYLIAYWDKGYVRTMKGDAVLKEYLAQQEKGKE